MSLHLHHKFKGGSLMLDSLSLLVSCQVQFTVYCFSLFNLKNTEQYYAPTESRAYKAGTVQRHRKKHQHLIILMIPKINITKTNK